MPFLGPVQTDGVRFQSSQTSMIARGSFKAGDLAVISRPGNTSADIYSEIRRITGPLDLMRMTCILLGDATEGQHVKVQIAGFGDRALAHFGARLENEQPLVANVAGALTPVTRAGQRIIAYCRGDFEAPAQNRPERIMVPVFFDGLGGFGPSQ